jgi:hypothetical protein
MLSDISSSDDSKSEKSSGSRRGKGTRAFIAGYASNQRYTRKFGEGCWRSVMTFTNLEAALLICKRAYLTQISVGFSPDIFLLYTELISAFLPYFVLSSI